jgi:hypothetical protein
LLCVRIRQPVLSVASIVKMNIKTRTFIARSYVIARVRCHPSGRRACDTLAGNCANVAAFRYNDHA